MENNNKLVRMESFSTIVDAEKMKEGVFLWSGNFCLRVITDIVDHQPVMYFNLYYQNKDHRIEKAKERKEKSAEQEKQKSELIEQVFKPLGDKQ